MSPAVVDYLGNVAGVDGMSPLQHLIQRYQISFVIEFQSRFDVWKELLNQCLKR